MRKLCICRLPSTLLREDLVQDDHHPKEIIVRVTNGGSPSNKFAIAQRFGKDELRRRSQLEKTVNSAQWDEKKFQRICTPGAESNTRRSSTVYDGRQKRTHSFRIKYEGLFDLYPDFTGPRVHDPPNE